MATRKSRPKVRKIKDNLYDKKNSKMLKKILFLMSIILALVYSFFADTSKIFTHDPDLCFNHTCPTKSSSDTIIIEHDIFVLSMNPKTKFADWVAYKVEPKNLNGLNKQRVWREDPKLKPEYSFSPKDYEGGNKACGYDRGHQAPLANFSNNQHADQTNYLSNITPQLSKLNRGAWKRLEDKERLLAKKNKGEVYVFTGTYYTGKPMCQLPKARLQHTVPNGYWKIIILKNGKNVSHANFKFQQEATDNDYCNHSTTIEEINRLTNLKFPISNLSSSNTLLEKLGCN